MLDSFLRQVTKDSYGPVSFLDKTPYPVVVHKFQDNFSVLGWGRMPDPIAHRGRLAAFLFSKWNTAIQSDTLWKQFLKSPDALAFRKAGASIQQSGNLSASLNELADRLPVKSNFLGAISETDFKNLDQKVFLTAEKLVDPIVFDQKTEMPPLLFPVCEFIQEEKVPQGQVMGRAVWNHSLFRQQQGTRPLPFEFLCHFRLTDASLKRLKIDSVSLPKAASLQTLQAGVEWDFPVIELILAQNPFEKRVGLSEALWMTGMSPDQLQNTILLAAWVAAFMRYQNKKMTLNAIKLRFAMMDDGTLILNDNFLLEDFYLERGGHSLHPDATVEFYQKTSWFESVQHARLHAETFGLADWRRSVTEHAPFLDPKVKAKLESDQQELLKCLFE